MTGARGEFGSDERASSRGAKGAVGAVAVLGLVTLYVVLGGPLPFIPEGGPALDSVPSEADVVVYTDAWTFSSETSRDVVDGILTVSNESLPGYTGPASLSSAFESLDETSLEPGRLRSVTAFGSYDAAGRVGPYQGLVLKTTWSRSEIMTAFSDGPGGYDSYQHAGTAVFVDTDSNATLPAVAQLERDRFVVGTEPAVTDAIDAHEGRDGGVNSTLRSRFRELDRGPVRFVAAMPADLPGEPFLARDIARTIDGIETVGGTYYPDGSSATVSLTVGTTDAANATALQPMLRRGLTRAQPYVPTETRSMLAEASLSQSTDSVTISMSGPVDGFLGGYRSLIETGLLNLLTNEPVGQPALELVPDTAMAVGYADAGLVTDPTAQGVFDRLLTGQQATDPTIGRVFRGLETVSIDELTSFRSVTAFGTDIESNATDVGVIIQANWSTGGVRTALDAANATYREERYRGQRVFVVTEDADDVWIAALTESHQVVGTPTAVRDVIEVARGDRDTLSGPLAASISDDRRYLRVSSRVPSAVTDVGDPLADVVDDVEIIAVSYGTANGRVVGEVDLYFGTESQARDGAEIVRVLVNIGGGALDDDDLERLLDSTRVSRDGTVVTLTAETDPETLLGLVDRLTAVAEEGPTMLFPTDLSPAGEHP